MSDDGTPPPEADIVAAARAAHAMEFIERLPQGFDTRVGECLAHGQLRTRAFRRRRC